MATPRKKPNTPVNKKARAQKTRAQKPRSKKTNPKRNKQKSAFKKNLLVIFAVTLMIVLVVFGYFLGKNDGASTKVYAKENSNNDYSSKDLLHDLSKIKEGHAKEDVKALFTIQSKIPKKPVIVRSSVGSKEPVRHKGVAISGNQKAKLVIIIDDVSHAKQLARMQATGLKLTPAIFPPSELSMTSHTLAKGLKHAMIHLPMQSGSKQFNKQYKTLFINNSEREMVKRVKELRKLFPRVRYVNNHTGSVFTDSYSAMYTLYEALREEDFTFVDSRTIGSTKVPQIASEFGDRYIARDIFIDNEHSIKAIHSQLRKAVLLAKKRGHAIAIGHPHKITMQALSSATAILKEVDLVYIDTLYGQ